MIAKVRSMGLQGIGGYEVLLEVYISNGLPAFDVVGLPDAAVKIFLTASPEERARRRCRELEQRGTPEAYEKVLAEMRQRDYDDSHRAAAPLRQAEDAVLLDTTELDFDGSRQALLKIIRERTAQ